MARQVFSMDASLCGANSGGRRVQGSSARHGAYGESGVAITDGQGGDRSCRPHGTRVPAPASYRRMGPVCTMTVTRRGLTNRKRESRHAIAEVLRDRDPVPTARAGDRRRAGPVLIHGRAGELLSEQGGRVGLRLVVRLVILFSYVGLVVFAREQLRLGGALETDEQAK